MSILVEIHTPDDGPTEIPQVRSMPAIPREGEQVDLVFNGEEGQPQRSYRVKRVVWSDLGDPDAPVDVTVHLYVERAEEG